MYFTINGLPKALKRHRHTRYGKTYDPSKDDKKKLLKKIKPYIPAKPIEERAIRLMVIFYMPRPKIHYRTGKFSHLLKDNHPTYHVFTPDLDNLVKMVADTLNGLFYKDDSQIAQLKAEKIYCDNGDKPRTEIHIEQI